MSKTNKDAIGKTPVNKPGVESSQQTQTRPPWAQPIQPDRPTPPTK
jgi:hypothetical protein